MRLNFEDNEVKIDPFVITSSQNRIIHYSLCGASGRTKDSHIKTLDAASIEVLKSVGYKDCQVCTRPVFIMPEELAIIDDLFIPEGYRIKIMFKDTNHHFANYKTVYERGTDQV